MRYLLILLLLCQVSCQSLKQAFREKPCKKMEVRVTTYWSNSDKWTKKGLTSTGGKLECMKTCAVDPKTIPYNSTIKLNTTPPLTLLANDTGSAIVSRKAAKRMGKNAPVVDVYFKTKGQALAFISKNPYFVEAKIYD